MKLYNLYKEIILEDVSSDSVDTRQRIGQPTDNDINDAIVNKYAVLINYEGTNGSANGPRLIVPFAMGILKGNKVVRAYQEDGETKTKPNAWKLFRVDRITAWEPWKEYKNSKAPAGYNPNWDKTMDWMFKPNAKY